MGSAVASFLPVVGFPGYRVGNDGTVWGSNLRGRRRSRGRVDGDWHELKIKFTLGTMKYGAVNLYRDGKQHSRTVHTLVLEAFAGSAPEGMEACHIDGDIRNNNQSNLRYGTRKDNAEDRDRHGRTFRGKDNPVAKLDREGVENISKLYGQGLSMERVAKECGVSFSTVREVLNCSRWQHLGVEMPKVRSPKRKLTWNTVAEIRRRAAEGESRQSLAEAFGVGAWTVGTVIRGVAWKEEST